MNTHELINAAEDKVLIVLLKAQDIFGRAFELPNLSFDLRGRRAGVACVADNSIRLNLQLLLENSEDFIREDQ